MRAALLSVVILAGCTAVHGGGEENRYNSAGSSDEPSQGEAVLAGGAVRYEVTAWHLASGTHVDATIVNRGPGVLRIDPTRATLTTAAGEPVAPTPAGCDECPGGRPCAHATEAAALREIPAGGTGRVVRCFAPVNPFAGRHAVSGADPKRLAMTLRDDGLVLDGAPLPAVIEVTRR